MNESTSPTEAVARRELPPLPHIPGIELRLVDGWPGYAITNTGILYTCRRWPDWRIRRPAMDRDGYPTANLYRDGGKSRYTHIASLVLTVFVGPRPKGMVALRRDGNPANCAVENLLWGTSSDAAKNRVRRGRNRLSRTGILHPRAKLSDHQVAEIIARRRNGELSRDLAAEFKVSRNYVTFLATQGKRDQRTRNRRPQCETQPKCD